MYSPYCSALAKKYRPPCQIASLKLQTVKLARGNIDKVQIH